MRGDAVQRSQMDFTTVVDFVTPLGAFVGLLLGVLQVWRWTTGLPHLQVDSCTVDAPLSTGDRIYPNIVQRETELRIRLEVRNVGTQSARRIFVMASGGKDAGSHSSHPPTFPKTLLPGDSSIFLTTFSFIHYDEDPLSWRKSCDVWAVANRGSAVGARLIVARENGETRLAFTEPLNATLWETWKARISAARYHRVGSRTSRNEPDTLQETMDVRRYFLRGRA